MADPPTMRWLTMLPAMIERALEPRFFKRLIGRANQQSAPEVEYAEQRDLYSQLLDLFDSAIDDNAANHERGTRFEQFTSALFDGIFRPVSINYHTIHGEIDIVMENIGQGPFWNEFGGDIFIECKNLSGSSAALDAPSRLPGSPPGN
jgi:hypothetical protein